MGNDHVAAFLVDLDNLEVDGLVHELIIVADRLDIDLAAGEECLDTEDVDDHAALGAGLDITLDDLVVLESFVDPVPRLEGASLLVGKDELSLLVLCILYIDFHFVTDFEVGIVAELRSCDDALALAADGNDDFALADGGDFSFDYLALDDLGEGLVVGLTDFVLLGGIVKTGAFEGVPVECFRCYRCIEHSVLNFF